MNRFLLEHYVEHQMFYKLLLEQGVTTVNYPIQSMHDWETWLGAHQEMSQSVWSGLGGGQSTDFSRLKYDDPGALQDWLQFHAGWHATVRETFGI